MNPIDELRARLDKPRLHTRYTAELRDQWGRRGEGWYVYDGDERLMIEAGRHGDRRVVLDYGPADTEAKAVARVVEALRDAELIRGGP